MQNQIIVRTSDVLALNDEELFRLCAANRNLRIERDAHGNLIFMSPTGGETSSRNSEINIELGNWNRESKLGKVFDSNGGFVLPNGAMRAPDASWIPMARWEQLSLAQRKRFLPFCPDFVIELRSPSDRLADVQEKMDEWLANGCRLGWLIDPIEEQAFIYRADEPPTRVEGFENELSGEEVLPGFVLDLGLLIG